MGGSISLARTTLPSDTFHRDVVLEPQRRQQRKKWMNDATPHIPGVKRHCGGFRGQQAGAVGLGRQGYVAGRPPQVDTWPWLLPLAPGLKCLSSGASREAITASYGLPPLVSIPRDSPSWVSRPKRRCSLAPDRGCAPHARLCPWMFTQEGRHHRGTRAEVGRGV